jgi:hypothetical protein
MIVFFAIPQKYRPAQRGERWPAGLISTKISPEGEAKPAQSV